MPERSIRRPPRGDGAAPRCSAVMVVGAIVVTAASAATALVARTPALPSAARNDPDESDARSCAGRSRRFSGETFTKPSEMRQTTAKSGARTVATGTLAATSAASARVATVLSEGSGSVRGHVMRTRPRVEGTPAETVTAVVGRTRLLAMAVADAAARAGVTSPEETVKLRRMTTGPETAVAMRVVGKPLRTLEAAADTAAVRVVSIGAETPPMLID